MHMFIAIKVSKVQRSNVNLYKITAQYVCIQLWKIPKK
jgi:hypothetical protein